MQSSEKMPWNKEGSLHVQVEFQVPVPKVIPAAISAPTLQRTSAPRRLPDNLQHTNKSRSTTPRPKLAISLQMSRKDTLLQQCQREPYQIQE